MKISIIEWEESRRTGSVRPDGYSLHRSAEVAHQFVMDHWKNFPVPTPEVYSRPSHDMRHMNKEVADDSPLARALGDAETYRVRPDETELVEAACRVIHPYLR